MQAIKTLDAPAAIGPYSQALRVGQMIYFSGQIPLVPSTMTLISDDFKQQALQVFRNLHAVAVAAGGDLDKLISLTIYLTDLADFKVLNEVMLSLFQAPYPARTTLQVAALPLAAKIEVTAVMALSE